MNLYGIYLTYGDLPSYPLPMTAADTYAFFSFAAIGSSIMPAATEPHRGYPHSIPLTRKDQNNKHYIIMPKTLNLQP
jgi:hypothetical protein